MSHGRSSRSRFAEYRAQIRSRRKSGGGYPGRPQRQRSFFRLFREFLAQLGPQRRTLVLALVSLTVATWLSLAPIYGTKLVFDSVLPQNPHPPQLPGWLTQSLELSEPRRLLSVVSVGIVLLAGLAVLFGIWGRWQATRLSKRLQVSLRKRVFEHAVRLPLHRVHSLKSGGLASILRDDAGGVAELVFSMVYNPWRAIVQLLGTLVILAVIDWRLLTGALIFLPLVYSTHRVWLRRIRPLHRDIRASRQSIDGHVTEVFGGIRVVRGFARQRSEATRFTRDNDLMARQQIHAWWWMRGIDIGWAILIPLASAVLLWYGGTQILGDREAVAAGGLNPGQALTVGDLVMFLGYLVALLSPLETLANSATVFQDNLAGLDRVLDLLEEPQELPPAAGAVGLSPSQVRGRITLENVSFAYPWQKGTGSDRDYPHYGTPAPSGIRRWGLSPSKPADGDGNPSMSTPGRLVLRHLDLDVQPGETIALIGPSGAGKTTLCNLVARFYDPTEGRIRLDGRDLRDISIESYRRLLGIVEQDTFLFDGTIAENIGYGRRGADIAEIVEAARLANADEFIARLPQGYETLIGERGVKLSGGQRQRLSIARAILANPRILILDEATSHLDTESERLIQASLHTLTADKTCFVIAHRLSTILHADRIIVLEHGRIVEQGRHDELIRQSGRYAQMLEIQTQPSPNPIVSLGSIRA